MSALCGHPTAMGTACRMAPVLGYSRCWNHEPDLRDAAREARMRGGRSRHPRASAASVEKVASGEVRLRDPDAVLELIETAVLDTLRLENSVARSRAIAQLAGAALKAQEVAQLEERLARIEELMDQANADVRSGEVLVC